MTPSVALRAGAVRWWIRTWSDVGFGPWSNAMAFTVSAPGMATLVSPTATMANRTPTYTWNAVAGSTSYQLWVDDSTGNRIVQWYTATSAGCQGGLWPAR